MWHPAEPMPSQRERSAASRGRLLAAAEELVGLRGFASTSLTEIGAAAGMSGGAVQFHFGSKAGLADSLLERQVGFWRSVTVVQPTQPAEFGEVLDGYWAVVTEQQASARTMMMLLYEALSASDELQARLIRHRRTLVAHVVRQLGRLSSAPSDAARLEVFAELVVGTAIGVVAQLMLDPRLDADAVYAEARATLSGRWESLPDTGSAGSRQGGPQS